MQHFVHLLMLNAPQQTDQMVKPVTVAILRSCLIGHRGCPSVVGGAFEKTNGKVRRDMSRGGSR